MPKPEMDAKTENARRGQTHRHVSNTASTEDFTGLNPSVVELATRPVAVSWRLSNSGFATMAQRD
jgi:hypothetical protein